MTCSPLSRRPAGWLAAGLGDGAPRREAGAGLPGIIRRNDIGALHVRRAVRHAAFDIGAGRAAEEETFASRLAMRPAAALVGQFEQRFAPPRLARRRRGCWLRA